MLSIEEPISQGQDMYPDRPDPHIFPCWYANTAAADFFNVAALNDKGEVMIFEDLTALSAWGSWHLVNGLLKDGENPLTAAQQRLLKTAGYTSAEWLYLGSFMLNATQPNVTGHFFAAHNIQLTAQSMLVNSQTCAIRWVPPRELKYALLDGRIGIMSYAVTASLTLLMSNNQTPF